MNKLKNLKAYAYLGRYFMLKGAEGGYRRTSTYFKVTGITKEGMNIAIQCHSITIDKSNSDGSSHCEMNHRGGMLLHHFKKAKEITDKNMINRFDELIRLTFTHSIENSW